MLTPRQVFPSSTLVVRFAAPDGRVWCPGDEVRLFVAGSDTDACCTATVSPSMYECGCVVLDPEVMPADPGPYEVRFVDASGTVLGRAAVSVGDAEVTPTEVLPLVTGAIGPAQHQRGDNQMRRARNRQELGKALQYGQ